MASLKIATDLRNLIKRIIYDECYPVGSIYISMNSTSPATRFGGTWVQITNKFLYCTNSSKTTGGSSTTGGHTLSINEIPSHGHGQDSHQHWIWGGTNSGGMIEGWIPVGNWMSDTIRSNSNGNARSLTDWSNPRIHNTGGGGLIPILKIFLHTLLVTLGTEQLKESWCYL